MQEINYSQYGNFLYSGHSSAGSAYWTANEEVLGIDARGNKYFTSFVVGYYGGGSGIDNLKHYFAARANVPEDLPGGTNLVLQYNITKGSRVGSSGDSSWW